MRKKELKKIVFITDSLSVGGVRTVIINLARKFRKDGYPVEILLLKANNGDEFYLDNEFPVHILKKKNLFLILYALTKFFERHDKKTVFISGKERNNVLCILASFFSGARSRLITTIHTNLSSEYEYNKQLKHKLLRCGLKMVLPLAKNIVAVSQGVASDLRRWTFFEKEAICIYNPITDVSSLPNLSKKEPLSSNQWPVKLLIVGRLCLSKNIKMAIDVVAKLNSTGSYHLEICGDGPDREALQKYTNSLGLEDLITFSGNVSNVSEKMQNSDILLVSSYWEGFCNVIVEGLFYGLPVVSTDCPSGPSEILNDTAYGRLVPVGEVDDMCEAIRIIEKQEIDIDKLQNRALDFSIESSAKKYLKLIESL